VVKLSLAGLPRTRSPCTPLPQRGTNLHFCLSRVPRDRRPPAHLPAPTHRISRPSPTRLHVLIRGRRRCGGRRAKAAGLDLRLEWRPLGLGLGVTCTTQAQRRAFGLALRRVPVMAERLAPVVRGRGVATFCFWVGVGGFRDLCLDWGVVSVPFSCTVGPVRQFSSLRRG
jgi:hypothetical protein